MALRAGKLRHRVSIQAVTHVQDSYGDALQTWTTVATRWASIEPAGGRETYEADQQRPDVSGLVTMRPYAGLTTRHRLLFGSRVLNVESVIGVDEVSEEMRITYREEV